MTTITLPIDPKFFWAIVWLAAFALAVAAIYAAMPRTEAKRIDPLERLKALLGAAQIGDGLFLPLLAMWAALFLALFGGLMLMLWEVIWHAVPANEKAQTAVRFALVRLAAMTATLGAVAALPFTLIRLRLAREANNTAKQGQITDRINKAVEGLGSEKTVKLEGNEWTEPNLEVRIGALISISKTAKDNSEYLLSIIELISAYIRENSKSESDHKVRPDIQVSLNLLFSKLAGNTPLIECIELLHPDYQIDLSNTNLKKANLRTCNLKRVNLTGSKLDGADLRHADLSHSSCWKTSFQFARMDPVDLTAGNFLMANFNKSQLSGSKIVGAVASRANFSDTVMKSALLVSSRFNQSNFERANLSKSKVLNTRFTNTNLNDAKLIDSHVENCTFENCEVKNFNLSKSKIEETTLYRIEVSEVRNLHRKQFTGMLHYKCKSSTLGQTWKKEWENRRIPGKDFFQTQENLRKIQEEFEDQVGTNRTPKKTT
ncbi:pentapeptide repeat-containing protein [Leisingera aquaemixtae]|uniref:pentapeptide repeat-containing protein n=1 Tax=Leisingera aquaemixtae TaxID=1396826 RepID=UPI0021A8DD2D|nr:pentapeptide repeat-containing protein [Leisingera aquaemixtae]UWQ47248.1 pentapeptide repeat-containing protein [Leisingera aquaemixtae]